LVVFEDLECPECARSAPQEQQAAEQYNIPVVHRDFPLQQHPWSFEAAVLANWFEKQSPKLGTDFRMYIFKNQPLITPGNLRQFADKFAAEHSQQLPFVIDPNGELTAKINADKALGQRVGIEHTPTIYIVTNTKPAIEVVDRTQLFPMIERVKQEVAASAPPAKTPRSTSSRSTPAKSRARKQQ
jgi:protein-disulfide isomerase